jgi:hypothetical protein
VLHFWSGAAWFHGQFGFAQVSGTIGVNEMRLAFVLRLGNHCRPADGVFEGSVQEVDSCTEQRFHSTEQLLKFLGQRFDSKVLIKNSEQELGSEP